MAFREKIGEFISDTLTFGLATALRVRLKNNGGIFEARNNADTLYVIGRGADPVGNDDWVTKRHLDNRAGSELLWGNIGVAATTTTRFMTPGRSDATAPTTTIQIEVTRAGILQRMRVRHNVPLGNGNLIVYTVRVNGIATALLVSLASTAASGSDVVTTIAVVAGDLIDIQVTKALSIATSPTNVEVTVELGP